MKSRKHVFKSICLLILMVSLSGCWDQQELEKKAYVIAIGLDKAKGDRLIKITYQIANPEVGSQQQGGSAKEPPDEIISFTTNDLISARTTANVITAKQISYDLLGIIIVSEEFAENEEFIRWIYDATKGMEIRRDTKLVVSNEKANVFIKENNPKLETRPHVYFELTLKRGTETGMIPDSDLLKFFRITEADASLFLAANGSTQKSGPNEEQSEDKFSAGEFNFEGKTNRTNFAGSAVFKEGKMIGKLTGEETRLTVLLNETLQASDILATFPDPYNKKYQIATRITKKNPNKVVMDLKSGRPKINVTVPLTVDVLTNHSMVDYAGDREKRKTLEKQIAKNLKKKMEDLIKRTQEEFKGEPFGWSLTARKKFPTVPEYESFNWMKTYPDMKIVVDVAIKFSSFGRQGKLPEKQKVRD